MGRKGGGGLGEGGGQGDEPLEALWGDIEREGLGRGLGWTLSPGRAFGEGGGGGQKRGRAGP